jgi:CRISPR/Cas system CMR-associated protein Cmr1 (group 7 of RAMP superfamily)
MKYWRNKMIISQNDLNKLIKEEIEKAIEEGWFDRMMGKGAGMKAKAAGALSGLGAKAARGLGASTAAGEMDKASAERKADAPNQEKLGLMKQHSRKFSAMTADMIKDAQKVGLLKDPNFKKALASAKAVATRMNNIVAGWEKAAVETAPAPEGADEEATIRNDAPAG